MDSSESSSLEPRTENLQPTLERHRCMDGYPFLARSYAALYPGYGRSLNPFFVSESLYHTSQASKQPTNQRPTRQSANQVRWLTPSEGSDSLIGNRLRLRCSIGTLLQCRTFSFMHPPFIRATSPSFLSWDGWTAPAVASLAQRPYINPVRISHGAAVQRLRSGSGVIFGLRSTRLLNCTLSSGRWNG